MRRSSAIGEGIDGKHLYDFAKQYFPLDRSLTGEGVRQSLGLIDQGLSALTITEVPTGTTCYDWTIPREWNVDEAYIIDPSGKKIADFAENNLHLVGYSVPVDQEFQLEELSKHLHSLPHLPEAIPYLTSYYKERWGFCISQKQRDALKPGTYRVVIKSRLEAGSLTYGEMYFPGQSKQEIFISTYICHPSMGNNETSGPTVAKYLAQAIANYPDRKYSYRFAFVPETIGAIAFLSQHAAHLQRHVHAAFQLTCVGDNLAYSFLESRTGDTLSDKVALHALKHWAPHFKKYPFQKRGSDERQYCHPLINLPVVSMMRSKYNEFPEYHNSLDNLGFISAEGLKGAFDLHCEALWILEHNAYYLATFPCEPQLSKRGLYPELGTTDRGITTSKILDVLAFCDGKHDLIDIADRIGAYAGELVPVVNLLKQHQLITEVTSD